MFKNLTFDFFKVAIPEESGISFEDVLLSVDALTGEERAHDMGDHPIRLQHLEKKTDYYIGDVAKIRMNDIPDKMKLSGETTSIGLDNDEGLGEISTFVFHPATSVLTLLRNRNAVRITGFSNYFDGKCPVPNLSYDYILQAEAYTRLENLKRIQRVDVEVAAPGNSKLFKDLDITPSQLLDLQKSAPRVRVAFTYSMAHDKSSLPKNNVMSFATKLRDVFVDKNEDIKMIVSGNDVMERETIDLFGDSLFDTIKVDIGSQRRISDNQRRTAAIQAWSNNRSYITKVFTKS